MHPLIEKVLTYSNHRAGPEGSISVTRLIGPAYQAKLHLEGRAKTYEIPAINRRGSCLGSGFHLYCEEALQEDPNIMQEIYSEKKHEDQVITGTCDLMIREGDTYRVGDWKTGVATKFDEDHLDKAKLQLSLYRWMLSSVYPQQFQLEGDVFYISTSRNVAEHYELDLLTNKQVENYISSKLYLIQNTVVPDCEKWACAYCEFDCEHRRVEKSSKGE